MAVGQTSSSLDSEDVATLLFDQPMWSRAPAGATLRYGFSRRAGRQTVAASFDDDIVVKLEASMEAESRTCDISMYSGKHARPAGPFYSTKINPVLVLVLEQNVLELGRLTGVEPGEFRDAIRKAWRDSARISVATVDVAGRRMPGTRIDVTPYIDVPDRGKMKGFDRLTYAVEIADGVPGRIARIDIRTPAGSTPVFSETLRYLGKGR